MSSVESACVAVSAVFHDCAWRDDARRATVLRRSADDLDNEADQVVQIAGRETGLPPDRLASELERATVQLRLFAELVEKGEHLGITIDPPDPDARPTPRPALSRIHIPVGPVAVFGASNFPLAFGVAGGDTAAAWAAGCPVVAKGHPAHPQTNELIASVLRRALIETELPAGALGLIQSADHAVAEALVDDPRIAAVAFTGSRRAGRALFDRAARRPVPIPVYAEMGSTNPVLLTAAAMEARGESIAAGLALAVVSSAGQFCTKPNVALLWPGAATEGFLSAFAARFAAIDPGPMLYPALRQAFDEDVATLRAVEGVEVIAEGVAPAVAFLAPAGAALEHDELLEEHFGPSIVLLSLESEEQLWDVLAHFNGQLAAAVHAESPQDDALVTRLLPELASLAGRVVFNGFPTGVAVAPAMTHGGPYPATTSPRDTSVGTASIARFLRPVTYQNVPERFLPSRLR